VARKNDQILWVGIAAAVLAAVYFMTNKKSFTANIPGANLPAADTSYLKPVSSSGVADIVSNLASTQLPLQLTPPDNTLLRPLNLDLNEQTPGQVEETNSENYDV
jgi:hypothetical protein